MIKLTLTPTTQPISYFFDKKIILIGKPSFTEIFVDLPIAKQEIHTAHVKIEESDGQFIAYNLANDPYTTINSRSFGKATLQNGDILSVGQTPILFEGIISDENHLEDLLQEKIEKHEQQEITSKIEPEGSALNFEAEIRQFEQLLGIHGDSEPIDQTQFHKDIDTLLSKVEELETALLPVEIAAVAIDKPLSSISVPVEASPASLGRTDEGKSALSQEIQEEKTPASQRYEPKSWEEKHGKEDKSAIPKRQSLKDFYLSEFDDENENWNPLKEKRDTPSTPRFVINWKALMSAAGVLIALCTLVLGLFYLNFIGRSGEEELKAAEAVADIAMALNYAQINHTLPQNQNWSDPEFLKSNLLAVLDSEYQPLANVDSHGQLLNSAYILRIYTNSDLNHFLVIAQPNASLLQWLIPKGTIIVDSSTMELRKTTDLKTLNRLLVNPTLDATNSTDIAQLVKQGKLIPLVQLAEKYANNGFTTPKALALIRSGAENLIYNALRYYHFSERLVNKAIAIYESDGDSHSIELLKQEIDSFSRFPNIVLYSSDGLQTAILGQRALATFIPQTKFLFAYLQFNAKGLVANGHLLIDDNSSELALATSTIPVEQHEFEPEPTPIQKGSLNKENKFEAQKPKLFDNLLATLYKERHKSLTMINDQISDLINLENREAIPNFSNKLHQLQKQYEAVSAKYQKKIIAAISFIHLGEILEDKGIMIEAVPMEVYETNSNSIVDPIPQSSALSNSNEAKIDRNHPLFYKLTAIHNARQQALKPLSDQMQSLLHEENQTKNHQKLNELETRYENMTADIQEKIVKAISNLQHEYSTMPLTEFMAYIKAVGLESFIQESLLKQLKEHENKVTFENFDTRLLSIQRAQSLKELDESLTETALRLTIEKVPDTALLISYQNKVHAEATTKLDEFLLSSKNLLRPEDLLEKNRGTIVRILKNAWVTDTDELDYYLNEFDLLIHRR